MFIYREEVVNHDTVSLGTPYSTSLFETEVVLDLLITFVSTFTVDRPVAPSPSEHSGLLFPLSVPLLLINTRDRIRVYVWKHSELGVL